MTRYCICILAVVALIAPCANAKINVVTTVPDLAAITQAVGGDHVNVQSIAKGYQDPHYVQAKPSFMRLLNRADLLVYVGLELEVGWLPLIIQGARNPHIASSAAGLLNASAGIRRLEVPQGQVDRSMGDVHPEGNPHYLLDPRNGLIVAQTLANKLSQLDPEHAPAYQENLKHFQSDLTARIADWETRLANLRGKKVITYHKLWEYLTDWLQMDIASQVENKPGIPPSPRHVAELIDRMKTDGITLLLASDYSNPKPAERVAQQTDATLLTLPASVGAQQGIDTYADLFDAIVSLLTPR